MPIKKYYDKYKQDKQFRKKKSNQAKKYYQNHKKERDEKHKEYVHNNKEKVNQKRKVYRAENKEKYNYLNREWQKKNKDKVKKINRISRLKNPTLQKLLSNKRRAKLKGLAHAFTKNEWITKLHSTKGICPKCKKKVGVKNLTLDHTPPISKAQIGFVYTIADVQPLCNECNSRIGNRK